MAEYIERQKVIDMLKNAALISDEDGEYSGYYTEDVDIESMPAADVKPVMRAEWIKRSFVSSDVFCSECRTIEKNTDSNYRSRYCPHCGAKMNSEENIVLYTKEEIEKAKMIRFLFPSAYELCKCEGNGIAICQKNKRIALIDDDSFFPSLPKGKSDTLENIIKEDK